MEHARRILRSKAITALIAYEISMLQSMKSRKETEALRYFNSTPTRDYFAKVMVHARLTDTNYSVSYISEILSITRLSAQTMVNQCESAGWVESFIGKRGRRMCRGTEYMLEMADAWFDQVVISNNESKAGASLRVLHDLEELTNDAIISPK